MKKIGYITTEFNKDFIDKIYKWSLMIPKEEIIKTEINGKIEGGNVTENLHLTLFYGFDENKLNRDDLLEFVKKISITEVEIDGLDTFPIPQYKSKILFLKVRDKDNILNNIHESFKRYPYFAEFQSNIFTPHISIAYIKEDFDITKLQLPSTANILPIREIKYHSKVVL